MTPVTTLARVYAHTGQALRRNPLTNERVQTPSLASLHAINDGLRFADEIHVQQIS